MYYAIDLLLFIHFAKRMSEDSWRQNLNSSQELTTLSTKEKKRERDGALG